MELAHAEQVISLVTAAATAVAAVFSTIAALFAQGADKNSRKTLSALGATLQSEIEEVFINFMEDVANLRSKTPDEQKKVFENKLDSISGALRKLLSVVVGSADDDGAARRSARRMWRLYEDYKAKIEGRKKRSPNLNNELKELVEEVKRCYEYTFGKMSSAMAANFAPALAEPPTEVTLAATPINRLSSYLKLARVL